MLTSVLIGFVLLPLLVTASIAVVAEPPAGVIAYACVDSRAQVLLAYDNGKDRNGWAAFGGHGAKGESIADTAAREFREETSCMFATPQPADLEGRERSRVGPFYTYVAEVEYVDPAAIAASSCGTIGERKDWIWVNLEDLVSALRSGDDVADVQVANKSYPLWFAGRLSLQQALRDGLLPESSAVCLPK
ncbi:NUDIX hydrolase [Oceanobacter sp. 5_MG-2023]|uniref:NUDIX hydrolase n=1 Tax=Oceanobacter sp. 5_MG-2023 TaxID=3062645 RepID=UPI0026E22E10|nr:NUDIX hydrolase [Oceanobacter sp. 5_MG-2023]MDO6683677.1 NUDIX hydrolase [Oceanobacter sp. 5_MG-2023]